MMRFTLSRLVFSVVFASALLSVTASAQSQDSIADAARRTREKKKTAAKPAKVITDETLDVKKGDVQSAAAEQLRIPAPRKRRPSRPLAMRRPPQPETKRKHPRVKNLPRNLRAKGADQAGPE